MKVNIFLYGHLRYTVREQLIGLTFLVCLAGVYLLSA